MDHWLLPGSRIDYGTPFHYIPFENKPRAQMNHKEKIIINVALLGSQTTIWVYVYCHKIPWIIKAVCGWNRKHWTEFVKPQIGLLVWFVVQPWTKLHFLSVGHHAHSFIICLSKIIFEHCCTPHLFTLKVAKKTPSSPQDDTSYICGWLMHTVYF